MTYYCPFCWKEVEDSSTICPFCGAGLENFSILPYEEKLLAALKHPIPENRRMAIQVLGQNKSVQAIPAFESLLESEEDIYVLIEVLQALKAMGTDESAVLIRRASNHRFSSVRHLATEMLRPPAH